MDSVVFENPAFGVKVWQVTYEGLGSISFRYYVQKHGQPQGGGYRTKAGAIRKARTLLS